MKRHRVTRDKPPAPSHNLLQRIRTSLGLTQQHVADLLGVSRSAVAMDEQGQRSLPWQGMGRVLALHQALPAAPAARPPLALTAADRDELDFRRRGLAVQLYPLEQQLAQGRVRLAQAHLWQRVLPALRQSFEATDTDWQEWLDYFERRAASVLRSESGAAALLELRLAVLTFELGEIARLLGAAARAGA